MTTKSESTHEVAETTRSAKPAPADAATPPPAPTATSGQEAASARKPKQVQPDGR